MNKYTIDYINDIKNTINIELDISIINILNEIDIEINANNELYIDEKNRFTKPKLKNKKYVNNNFETNEKIMQKNLNKSDIIINKDFFKKIINKISVGNFDKLSNEFIINYKRLIEIYDKSLINEINEIILKSMISNNKIFFNLYCKILFDIIQINNDILNNLIFYETIFKNIFHNIKISNNLESLEDQLKNDKINDFNKQICLFFINCYLNNIVDNRLIYTLIIDLHNNLLEEIKKPDNKVISETIVEFLNLILTEILNKSIFKDIDIDNKIYENILLITSLKRDSYFSISNKIIFKFKDIEDKIV